MSNKAEEKAEIAAAREKVKDWSRDDLIAECLNLYDRLDRTNEILRLTSAEMGELRKQPAGNAGLAAPGVEKEKDLEEPEADVNAVHPPKAATILLGGIDALTQPDYHALNAHDGRNDRLLHATLCAYAKWHLDTPDIGSDQLSGILYNAICEAIGDNAFVEWVDKIKGE